MNDPDAHFVLRELVVTIMLIGRRWGIEGVEHNLRFFLELGNAVPVRLFCSCDRSHDRLRKRPTACQLLSALIASTNE